MKKKIKHVIIKEKDYESKRAWVESVNVTRWEHWYNTKEYHIFYEE